jgi:hypothetical protein
VTVKPEPYDVGDTITVQVAFTDQNGAAADPTSVTIKIEDPAGNITSYTGGQLTHTGGTGIYSIAFAISLSGRHHTRAVGTDPIAIAIEGSFNVRDSHFD